MNLSKEALLPDDRRALIAIDLGAESCRVSLLRWIAGEPSLSLVHRFANLPRQTIQGLQWDLKKIEAGLDVGLRRCAEIATEGVRSIAVDGWAVDYVRLDKDRLAAGDPFCYRDERTITAEASVHARCSPERLRELTGVQLMRINTLYQLHADELTNAGRGKWLNLPEYVLYRLGARPVAELTNASHSQMVELASRTWAEEIFAAVGLEPGLRPELVPPGTVVGRLRGDLAKLPVFADTLLIAPACHDTASAVAGIPAVGEDWAYISCGTWSLVGTTLSEPRNGKAVGEDNFTNLGAVGGRFLFHKNVNGMWLLQQSISYWAERGRSWSVADLVAAAATVPCPAGLLDVDDPNLLLPGRMPERINSQRSRFGLDPLDEDPSKAPAFASLMLHSLAARYAEVLERAALHSGKQLRRLFLVGGGSQNQMLARLTAEATGMEVLRGSAESATIGNFAVQLAALGGEVSAVAVGMWAARLQRDRSTVPAHSANG